MPYSGTVLRERFEMPKREGYLLSDADPTVLAACILMVAHGIAVQAKAGFSEARMTASRPSLQHLARSLIVLTWVVKRQCLPVSVIGSRASINRVARSSH